MEFEIPHVPTIALDGNELAISQAEKVGKAIVAQGALSIDGHASDRIGDVEILGTNAAALHVDFEQADGASSDRAGAGAVLLKGVLGDGIEGRAIGRER
ncbi:hypothetical protein D9M68_837620 [compost metagenome]